MGGFFPRCQIVKCENILILRKDFVGLKFCHWDVVNLKTCKIDYKETNASHMNLEHGEPMKNL